MDAKKANGATNNIHDYWLWQKIVIILPMVSVYGHLILR